MREKKACPWGGCNGENYPGARCPRCGQMIPMPSNPTPEAPISDEQLAELRALAVNARRRLRTAAFSRAGMSDAECEAILLSAFMDVVLQQRRAQQASATLETREVDPDGRLREAYIQGYQSGHVDGVDHEVYKPKTRAAEYLAILALPGPPAPQASACPICLARMRATDCGHTPAQKQQASATSETREPTSPQDLIRAAQMVADHLDRYLRRRANDFTLSSVDEALVAQAQSIVSRLRFVWRDARPEPPAPVPASAQPTCICGHDYEPWHAPGMEGGDACGFKGCQCRMFLAPSALPASAPSGGDVETIILHVSAAMAHRFSNSDAEASDYAPYLREVVDRLKGDVQ